LEADLQRGSRIPAEKEITVLYFAEFRDLRGLPREKITTTTDTVGDLYRELCGKFDLPYRPGIVRAAVNEELSEWHTPLSGGETVVFLAPFGGG